MRGCWQNGFEAVLVRARSGQADLAEDLCGKRRQAVEKSVLISSFGFLRLALVFLGLAMVFLVPDPKAELILEWPEVLFVLVAPVMAPLFF